MTEGKKFNVGPLPSQTDDYSQFEETALRWDRIAIVVALPLVVILVAYFLVSGPTETASHTEDASFIEKVESPVGLTKDAKSTKETKSTQEAISKRTEEPASIAVIAEGKEQVVTQSGLSSSVNVAPPIEVKPVASKNEAKKETETSGMSVQVAYEEFASVIVVNSHISEAVLTLNYVKNKPIEPIKRVVQMSEAGIIKVNMYTRMEGLKGQSLFHEWYWNGKQQARVKIPVNRSTQSSYSSKYVNKQMLGNWQVKVVDSDNEPYVLADFEVIGR